MVDRVEPRWEVAGNGEFGRDHAGLGRREPTTSCAAAELDLGDDLGVDPAVRGVVRSLSTCHDGLTVREGSAVVPK